MAADQQTPDNTNKKPIVFTVRHLKNGVDAQDSEGNSIKLVFKKPEEIAAERAGKNDDGSAGDDEDILARVDDTQTQMRCDSKTPIINSIRLLQFAPEIKKQVAPIIGALMAAPQLLAEANELNPVGQNGSGVRGRVKDALRSITVDSVPDIESTSFMFKLGTLSPLGRLCKSAQENRIFE